MLDRFRSSKEKFAVVINEYALVVGVITLSDIMTTVMGDWVTPIEADQQIFKRDENSWLIEGSTPIEDIKHALGIDEMPDDEPIDDDLTPGDDEPTEDDSDKYETDNETGNADNSLRTSAKVDKNATGNPILLLLLVVLTLILPRRNEK